MSTESCMFDTEEFKREIKIHNEITTITLQQYRDQGGPVNHVEGVRTEDMFCAYDNFIDRGIATMTDRYNDTLKVKKLL
jgi:hypothetical protein